MKFTVTMKDPDTLQDAIEEAAKEDVATIAGLDDADRDDLIENRKEMAQEIAGKWFEYGEYLRVEIDTDARTCTVLPVK